MRELRCDDSSGAQSPLESGASAVVVVGWLFGEGALQGADRGFPVAGSGEPLEAEEGREGIRRTRREISSLPEALSNLAFPTDGST